MTWVFDWRTIVMVTQIAPGHYHRLHLSPQKVKRSRSYEIWDSLPRIKLRSRSYSDPSTTLPYVVSHARMALHKLRGGRCGTREEDPLPEHHSKHLRDFTKAFIRLVYEPN